MRCSGLSPDGLLVEMIELPDHPWFIGCSSIPELKSRPMRRIRCLRGLWGAPLSSTRSNSRASISIPKHVWRSGSRLTVARFSSAGPCVVERTSSRPHRRGVAELGVKLGISVIYKASYDKAIARALNAPRGPGLESGLRALEKVRAAPGFDPDRRP